MDAFRTATAAGALVGALAAPLLVTPTTSALGPAADPGAPGAGDPYYPLDGNGGYEVGHYGLDLAVRARTDRLRGTATIHARALQRLDAFNLDFDGMHVNGLRVNGERAGWTRARGELTVQPRRRLRAGGRFTVVIDYAGTPQRPGYIHTDDGSIVIGQPHSASTWFPVNDHPEDKASYLFRVAAPRGDTVVANGRLRSRRAHGASATWVWEAREPMAPYLASVAIGDFDLRSHRRGGLRFWDAIDETLLAPYTPHSGSGLAFSRRGNSGYKRLTREIDVPVEGADLTFWIERHTEEDFDFVLVEAHTVGADDWTTLRDRNGHTRRRTGFGCPAWLELHPFLSHYQEANGEEPCRPSGTTGAWHAASGESDGWEKWSVDLAGFAGQTLELSLSVVSDEAVQLAGALVDDVVVSTGQGSTSFEADADPMDGWTVSGSPAGSPENHNDWTVGTKADTPVPPGVVARRVLGQQDEMIRFFTRRFGRYPFSAAGGLVEDLPDMPLGWGRQTRPFYPAYLFNDSANASSWVAHETAHQWFGASLTVRRWRHVWLNEGFARYAQWLWDGSQGGSGPAQMFDSLRGIPADDEFWDLRIGDPGRDRLLDFAVIDRGGMTLEALRRRVGTGAFFRILGRWTRDHAGGHVTTRQFVRLAEQVSGRNLDRFFDAWLFTPAKPRLGPHVGS